MTTPGGKELFVARAVTWATPAGTVPVVRWTYGVFSGADAAQYVRIPGSETSGVPVSTWPARRRR